MYRFVELSHQTKSPKVIFDLLVKTASDEGFDRVAYGSINYFEILRSADYTPQAIILNYPLEWQRSYFERKDYEIDPVLLFSPQIARPFSWKGLTERRLINKRQRNLFGMAEDVGLRDGISVPIQGKNGNISVVSFASSHTGTDASAKMHYFEVLASQFHIAFCHLSDDDRSDTTVLLLSDRERDCMSWTAEGKSSWDIGSILNISENTVNFHIKNAMRKLDTSSRTVAVIKAIRLGIIDLPSTSQIQWQSLPKRPPRVAPAARLGKRSPR